MTWETMKPYVVSIVERLAAAIIVFLVGMFIIKLILRIMKRMKRFKELNLTAHRFLCNFVKCVLYVVLIVTIISILGVPMASVVAIVASAAAAIGLALQGSLSNLAGGIILIVTRPFKIGDYIDTVSVSGTVHDIGIFYTTLICPDNKHVTIPNGILTSNTVTNYSVEDIRRLDIVYKVEYGTDIEEVKKIVLGVVEKHPDALKDPEPSIRLTEMADSSIDFTLKVWVKKENYWGTKFDLLETVKGVFKEKGIEIPYNKLDIKIVNPEK